MLGLYFIYKLPKIFELYMRSSASRKINTSRSLSSREFRYFIIDEFTDALVNPLPKLIMSLSFEIFALNRFATDFIPS